MSETPETPQDENLEIRETFKIASEFAPNVTVTDETFFGHGWQPLTTSILMSLWFLPADASFDVPFLVDWYKRLGWKGANGKPLGAPVIRREIGLIREAGYVSVTRLRGESGQAVGIQYSVSQRRSDQPETGAWIPVLPGTEGIRRSDHVWPMTTRGESPHVVDGDNRRSDHMQAMATRGESPHVVDAAKPQVGPRVANENSASAPPHPPEEEVGTTSPSPHKRATASRRNKQPAPEVDAAALTAAAKWLMKLPGDWAAGVQRAESLAPWLVRNAELTDWDLDMSLRMYLTRQDPGQKPPDNYGSVLGYRIKNMQPKEAVMAAAAEKAEAEQAEPKDSTAKPASQMRDWCGKCNRGERPAETFMRVIPSDDPDDEKVTRCPDCHPAMTMRKHSNA
ncbi:hypothetical protein [Streptomyces anulatus]|uniref:hypothetical protein n=1 Tax=Streptomyces anulatus TaxID=1892 RepID=UPI0036B3E7A5